MSDLLSPGAVARMKDCSRNAVLNAIKRGHLRATRILGDDLNVSGWGVDRDSAEAWRPERVGGARRGAGRKRKELPEAGRGV